MKISVIIPVYNAEKYVAQAVESALQFQEVSEVILVEDQSPDNALEVCEKLVEQFERVKLFQHPDKGNHGAGESRNVGMRNATGDFIAFLDADDFYLPNRFDAEKTVFQNPHADGVYGAIGVHYWSEKAKEQFYHIYQEKLATVYETHPPEDVFPGLIGMRGSFGLFSIDALTIRKSALEKMDLLMKTDLKLHQDTDFLMRLAFYTNLYPGILDQPVAVRGVHESNRISQLDSGKVKPAKTRVLLWKHLKNWAEKEPKMPKEELLHITRIHRSFEIAHSPFFKKWGMILKYLVLDFKSMRSGLYNINFRKTLFQR
ncbi:glycosyltransferase family 2 protein [Chryseobacterium koreense]|uniref:Capsular biosynthesis protein CpsI n=1 Tax=Chryseobacterium koreense CCUG 49689 TaxID=1304281 RepID=A0A0J7J1K7_9FLAO|nr:glycosyltransferase family 2 protein [Chryseobacterium koreense]KMQ72127.1 capsular biosynthesis protein CpsI [Chryseobacterium koreense CCUG 49689]MBB5331985.1 glycosyltransferase involved in cell wall biosynthesis [Chryseobacterium koreense]